MRGLAALLVAVLLSGCGATLRPDGGKPALEYGYPTAEIEVRGERVLGLAMVSIKKGEALSSLRIGVQGYFSGSIRAVSRDCEFDQTLRYENHQLVRLPLTGAAERNCLFTFTVTPEYDESLRRGVDDIHNFRGHVAVRVTDGEPWRGTTRKVAGNFRSFFRFKVEGTQDVRVVFNGCKSPQYDARLTPAQGLVSFPVHEAVKATAPDFCVLDGFALNSQNDISLNVAVALYRADFSPLPKPVLTIEDGSLKVSGDENVSIVSMDSAYIVNREAAFKFDATKPHVLRLLTVKGRVVLCTYEPGKEFQCQN